VISSDSGPRLYSNSIRPRDGGNTSMCVYVCVCVRVCVCVCVCVIVPAVSVERRTVEAAARKVKYQPRRRSVSSESRRVLGVTSLDHSCTLLPPPRPRFLPLRQRREDFSWTSKPPFICCPLPASRAVQSLRPLPFDDLQMTLKR